MASIFPPPADISDKFGLDLVNYLPQPGASWTVNRYGFDNGHRQFLVNKSVIAQLDFAMGSADFEYPQMFVNKITQQTLPGPWTIVDVDYLGLIQTKPIEVSTDTDTRRTTITIGYALFFNLVWQIDVPEITVQTVYVQSTQPDINLVGKAFSANFVGNQGNDSPPIFVAEPNLDSINNAIGLAPGTLRIFTWFWELRKRSLRIAGVASTLPPNSRLLTGNITLTNGQVFFQTLDNSGHFLTELDVGARVYAVSPPVTQYNVTLPPTAPNNRVYTEFHNGFTIATIGGDHNAYISAPYYGGDGSTYPVNFTGQFYKLTPNHPPSAATLYEVTDSWKRIVMLVGEPIANAIQQ